jgi:hypothetical protein
MKLLNQSRVFFINSMEKIRLIVISIVILIIGILVFTLTKSWLVYDRGVEVEVEPVKKDTSETKDEIPDSLNTSEENEVSLDWAENSRIHWKNTLVYPVGLNTESGGLGSDGVQHHAKNIIVVSLGSGTQRKLFPKSVYIWDFFPADFQKKSGFTISDEPRFDSIHLEGKMLIFAATIDTNEDGFLSNKDKKKIFVYDSNSEKLTEVLPESVFFEKLLWNAGKNRLAIVATKVIHKADRPKDFSNVSAPLLFIHDFNLNKNSLLEITEK